MRGVNHIYFFHSQTELDAVRTELMAKVVAIDAQVAERKVLPTFNEDVCCICMNKPADVTCNEIWRCQCKSTLCHTCSTALSKCFSCSHEARHPVYNPVGLDLYLDPPRAFLV